ncbi:MAG: iron-containing alcohol dehydrogenase [Clostridia bacterium]|nr:iron-containing alcohol dehydrogenase [Clostridia bacterium]
MNDFIYYAPTKVYFGKDKENEVGKIIKDYGYKTIMMQYGKESIKKIGLYDRVMKSLKDNEIEVIEMGGVEPNPKVEFVREAIKVAKENKVEMILAVGGGSVIDSSKATAAGAMCDFDVWKFSSGEETPKAALPVGCILTLAAAGSEMSASAVLTDLSINMKRGYGSEFNRCKFAICNPELTYSVNKYNTACGIVDIMAHTMERYFTPVDDTPLTDSIAESILKSVIDAGKVLMTDPENYEARATVMWASSLSHNDLTGCGRANYLAVHQLEHALSGEFDFVAHGAGLAVLFPAWAKYIYKHNIKRFSQFARNVWNVKETDDEKCAIKGIECMEEFFKSLGMPTTLKEIGISNENAEKMALLCTFNKKRTIKSFVELDYEIIKDIFEMC